MLFVITLASKKSTIMHYTTALNASKKRMTPTIGLKFLCASSNCDVTIRQNHFAGVALFFKGEEIRSDTFCTDLEQSF